jgi:MFS transporter, putative metabolite:H+ symporter
MNKTARISAIQQLDRQSGLTGNQRILVGTAAIGCMLEFWEQYLIAFVLAFVIRPWDLSFGTTAFILLSSGIGGIVGGIVWGYVADRYGRKPTFAITILVFSFASLALAFTPDRDWVWLVAFRGLLGFGTGGFFVPVTLVQETVPAELRGRAVGIVSATTSGGLLLGALCGAFIVPAIGWRGMFALGALPALYALFAWHVLPESPRWAALHGKMELARQSLAWALGRPASDVDLARATAIETRPQYRELGRYPRSLLTGILVNVGFITGYYGFVLWSPTLLSQVQGLSPADASSVMIGFTVCGIIARLVMSVLTDRFGRKRCGGIGTLAAAIMLLVAGFSAHGDLLPADFFWLPLLLAYICADGSFMVLGLYTSEIWPSRLRGVGSGICFAASGVGKIAGPLGLGLIAGSSNLVLPQATINAAIPAFAYFAGWFLLVSAAFLFIGIETKGQTLEEIEAALDAPMPAPLGASAK